MNPRPADYKSAALPTELFPPPFPCKLVERGGFEPPKAEPADLQSAPFGHSGTSPRIPLSESKSEECLGNFRSWRFSLPFAQRCFRVVSPQRSEPFSLELTVERLDSGNTTMYCYGINRIAVDLKSASAGSGFQRFHPWSQRRESNPRPTDYKSVALPSELRWP